MNTFKKLINDESGATAIEYGLLAALLSVMVIAGAKVAGSNISGLFTTIGTEMSEAKACADKAASAKGGTCK